MNPDEISERDWRELFGTVKPYMDKQIIRDEYHERRQVKTAGPSGYMIGEMPQARFMQLAREVAKGNDSDGSIHRRLRRELEAQEAKNAIMGRPQPEPARAVGENQAWLEQQLEQVCA